MTGNNWDCSYKKGGSLTSVLPRVDTHKKIGIFGGSFNPPHLGHAIMTLSVLMTEEIDEIWVLPCANHSEKKNLESFKERMKMCEQTFGHIRGVKVLPAEKFLPEPSFTLNTLRAIKALRPKADLHFIIGTDLVEDIPQWENSEGLTDYAKFLIVPRQGYPLVEPPKELGEPLVVNLSFDLPALSSTLVNRLTSRGASVKGFVAKEVYHHLKED